MKYKFSYIFALVGALLIAGNLHADSPEGGKKGQQVQKTAGAPAVTKFNINNISTFFRNDGFSDNDPITENSGFEFPKGSNKQAFFQSGFLYGGVFKNNNSWRVGGSTFQQGQRGGKILPDKTPENINNANVRIYRVRRDYLNPSDNFSSEINDEGSSFAAVFAQYDKDWKEWPAADGAPFEDVDSNGTYDPNVDIPGFPGADQTIWFVANDLHETTSTQFYGTLPLGIEMQTTIWGYNQTGALGNMLFRKYKIINKGGANIGGGSDIEDMYVCMWSDPDLGSASDDFLGCDTALSLGFVYNGDINDDGAYGYTPPAGGFDFFQGPIVESLGDSAIFNGGWVKDKKNLKMSSFFFFINQDDIWTDPDIGEPIGAEYWRRLFQGRISATGEPFVDPTTGEETKFALNGDPVTGKGWVDGILHNPGDRRLGMVAGPFNMPLGDTQEVVVAQIAAGNITGVNRISALKLLKFYDASAQFAYDNFFSIPPPPPMPKIQLAELDKEIVINWGFDDASILKTESYNRAGYKFQGYNIYQLPAASSTLSDATLVATYDIIDGVTRILTDDFDPKSGEILEKVSQYGSDSGIKRSISITSDVLTGSPTLLNGSKYYYAATAYAYNDDPSIVQNTLETSPSILSGKDGVIGVVPQSPFAGTSYGSLVGDTLEIAHTAGVSEGTIIPIVVDPTKTTGNAYSVTFSQDSHGDVLWSLQNTTTGEVLVKDSVNQTGDDTYPIKDGVMVKVIGPSPGMKDYSVPGGNANRHWSWVGGEWGSEGFGGAIGYGFGNWFAPALSSTTAGELKNVVVRFTATDETGNILNPASENISFGYRYMRGATAAPARPEFAPYIINPSAGYAYQDYTKSVPFSVWNVESVPPTRLMVGYLENNQPYGLVDGKYYPPTTAGIERTDGTFANNTTGDGPREWFYIFNVPYSETPAPELQTDILNNTLPIMWFGTVTRRQATYADNTEFHILANHINYPGDVFAFTAPAVTHSVEQAKADVDKINIFPNPYYGVNPQEINKYQRFVTINNLPDRATIRIFNLAGQLIRTIDKNSAGIMYQRWDLLTDNGLPVASGMYIIHVDMPELGKTKVLKAAIIQERQQVDRF